MRSTSPIEQSKPGNVSENVLLDCVWEARQLDRASHISCRVQGEVR